MHTSQHRRYLGRQVGGAERFAQEFARRRLVRRQDGAAEPGHEQNRHFRAAAAGGMRQLDPVHAGHDDIGNHQGHPEIRVFEQIQRRAAAAGLDHVKAGLGEHRGRDRPHIGVVVDQQHAAVAAVVANAVRGRRPMLAAGPPMRLWTRARGKYTRTVLPASGCVSMRTPPPSCCATPSTRDSPSPDPLPTSFVVKNGLNTLSRIAGAMPHPVSATETVT